MNPNRYAYTIAAGIVLFAVLFAGGIVFLFLNPGYASNGSFLVAALCIFIVFAAGLAAALVRMGKEYRRCTGELELMKGDFDKEKVLQQELLLAQHAQAKQQKLLQTIIDFSPTIVYLKNPNGTYALINAKLKTITGVTNEAELDEMFAQINVEKDNLYNEQDQTVIRDRRMVTFEDTFTQKNGKTLNLWVLKYPIFDERGAVEFICGFCIDITSFKQSEELMMEAKKEAENAKAAQEIFMANMSHEIRTPMNGIIGMTNLLLGTKVNDEQKDYLRAVHQSAGNLISIVNDLLDFSKIKSGKFQLESISFKPAEIIKNTIYPLAIKANEKNITLTSDIDREVPEILKGDPLRLQQMIINLVGNAIKFTKKGFVDVKIYLVSRIDGEIVLGIDVADTGIGIPEDNIERIFESYVQSNNRISRVYGGTGLGLAIVKQLAELQHGTVSVKSKYGVGATFTLNIPYQIPALADRPKKVKESGLYHGSLDGIHVLVAEDNIINQKVVKQTLQRQGATVVVADNGKIAVEKVQAEEFSIILMDLKMPEMDGFAATEQIRKVLNMDIPIVAMTADAMKGELEKCLAAGMDDFISKPFDPHNLYDKILQLTNRNHISQ